MTNCDFCQTETEQDICPTCCAVIPKSNCHSVVVTRGYEKRDYMQFINILTPFITTPLLAFYKGPACLLSLLLGAVGVTNICLQDQVQPVNKRSFYFVEKLLRDPYIKCIFETEDDFYCCRKNICQVWGQLDYEQRHIKDFSEVWSMDDFVLKSQLHIMHKIENWAAFFELIKTQVKVIHIDGQFEDQADAFREVDFSDQLESLCITNSNACHLNSSIWCVQREIRLHHLPYLERLPECEDIQSDSVVYLSFTHCGLTHLPRTMVKRYIDSLDVSNCVYLRTLPETLRKPLENGEIRAVNFINTGFPEIYRQNFLHKNLSFADEVFVNATPCEVVKLDAHPWVSNKAIKNTVNMLIPLSLIGLTIQKVLQPRNRVKVLPVFERPVFWGTFLTVATGTLAVASCINKHDIKKAFQADENACVDAIWAMFQKSGRELVDEEKYVYVNWDAVWEAVFYQESDIDRPLVPSIVKDFLQAWIDAREDKHCTPMAISFHQFIKENGGSGWAKKISSLPFFEMIDELKKKAFHFPEIQSYLCEFHGTIKKDSIALYLDRLFEGCTHTPPIKVLEGLFSFLKAGVEVQLDFDWLYRGIRQNFSFKPSRAIRSLSIQNGIFTSIPEDYWNVTHALSIKNCDGILKLPNIPVVVPRSPIILKLMDVMIEKMPEDICHRNFEEIHIINCPNLYFLTADLKPQIEEGVVKKLVIKNSGIKTKKEVYINDISVVKEPIFECCPKEPVFSRSPSWFEKLDFVSLGGYVLSAGVSFISSAVFSKKE